jgi:hypothetical protein
MEAVRALSGYSVGTRSYSVGTPPSTRVLTRYGFGCSRGNLTGLALGLCASVHVRDGPRAAPRADHFAASLRGGRRASCNDNEHDNHYNHRTIEHRRQRSASHHVAGHGNTSTRTRRCTHAHAHAHMYTHPCIHAFIHGGALPCASHRTCGALPRERSEKSQSTQRCSPSARSPDLRRTPMRVLGEYSR